MYEPKNKDDLYLFKKAFKKRRLSRKRDKDIRKITSQWTITGPETAKKMFFRWYVHQIDDNLGSENFLNDNCAHLRHLDEDITIESMKKICWQSVPCPFGFKRDFSPKRPNDTLKLDCRYHKDRESERNGCHNEDALVAHEWLVQVFVPLLNRFNLTLSGYFDDSNKRYLFINSRLTIEHSRHFYSSVEHIIKKKRKH